MKRKMKYDPIAADIVKPDSTERKEKIIKIPEYIVVDRLIHYINECDADELARLCGDIFGGFCSKDVEREIYTFEPDKFYAGEFDDLKEIEK